MANESDLEMIGKEHNITLMNHKYDIDWLMAWILAERLQMLGVTIDNSFAISWAVWLLMLEILPLIIILIIIIIIIARGALDRGA